jgi:SpoVK/Ycf46/Vps4 family AAA+-type ATPase
VNQLLSKLDGVEEMNNVLVICLTNRKDLIDSALLRPGRLEVHIEIKPPTIEGREEILYILFKPMVLGGYVSFEDAKKWSRTLAERTFGYTGADLTGLLRNAASFAIERSLSRIQSDNRYQQRSDLNPEEQKIEKTKNKISLEKSIFLLWNDVETAYLESSKELKISKRAKVNDFLRRNIFSKKQSKKDEEKVVRREFEDILNSVDFEAEDMINVEEENEENDLPDNDAFIVKPAFQNLGGTLIF